MPIRCYVKHDAEALARVSTLLTPTDADRLSRALIAVSERPLNVGRGLLTYASMRREGGATRVTVYLAPEAYSITSRRPSVPPVSGFSSGVHKASPRTSPSPALMSDARSLIARHEALLVAQPLFAHLAGEGTLAQATALTSQLSLLLLWLGDLSRFAEERASEPSIKLHLSGQLAAANARADRFRADLQALELSPTNLSLYTEEHALIREVAFARVAEVISAEEDRVRLGMALSIGVICERLLDAVMAFAWRASGRQFPTDYSVSDDASAPSLAEIRMSEPVAVEVYAGIERCFNSALKLVSAIDQSAFNASSEAEAP